MKTLRALLILILLGIAASGGWLYAGGFDIAADSPHSAATFALISWARERALTTRSADIKAPPLDDPKQLAMGADEYASMCQGCHLAPGVASDEFRDGLYPQPPNLSQGEPDSPAKAYWVIKHGIKGSAMPAWGGSHSDETMWAIAAFLQKLPSLTPEQYKTMTADAMEHHDEEHHEAAPAADAPAKPAEPPPG